MSEKIDLYKDLELLEDLKKLDSFTISDGYKSNIYSFSKKNKLSISQSLNFIFDVFFTDLNCKILEDKNMEL